MPNCDFYAAGDDLTNVLEVVFSLDDFRVFESYSPFDQELKEFKNPKEVSERYSLGECRGTGHSVLLSLFPLRAASPTSVRQHRISLQPEKCEGATFRWTVEGWGLIALHLGGASSAGIVGSHANHASESRARKWEPTYEDRSGSVGEWDWSEVSRASGRLNRRIRKLAVSKIGSRVLLPEAARLIERGVKAL